jgi:hypothetical protein
MENIPPCNPLTAAHKPLQIQKNPAEIENTVATTGTSATGRRRAEKAEFPEIFGEFRTGKGIGRTP